MYLYYGFSRAVTREEFARRIRENTLPEVLNAVPVHKGDVFFIPSGTLHAICRGIVIAEIQQSSNVTYRVYDYGRVGADGQPRALHIPQALAVTDLEPTRPPQFEGHLGSCRYFTADACAAPWEGVADERSFVGVLVVEDPAAAQGQQRLYHRRERPLPGDRGLPPAAHPRVRRGTAGLFRQPGGFAVPGNLCYFIAIITLPVPRARKRGHHDLL